MPIELAMAQSTPGSAGFEIEFPVKPVLKFIPTPVISHKMIFDALFILEPDLLEMVIKNEVRSSMMSTHLRTGT